jgi:predicted permease
MRNLFKDVRYACRSLASTPAFTASAVLILALGIAANSTVFSWINSTILNPIPGVSETRDLVSLMKGVRSSSPTPPFSYLDYLDLRSRTQSLTDVLAYHDFEMFLTGGQKPERVWGAIASPNYFEALRVRPFLGRAFLPSEGSKPASEPVVVISHRLWQTRFGGDAAIVGRSIQVNRHSYTVIGVAPPEFHGCKIGLYSDLWVPFTMDPVITGWQRILRRGTCWLQLLGRLRPGFDRLQAEQELNLLMRRIAEQYPDSHQGPNEITLDPLWRSPFGLGALLYSGLSMLQGLALVLLLLACANVANLVLVRSVGRRREISIRLSLGASRWQLVRQLLVESILVALAGGGVALLVTNWTAGYMEALTRAAPVPITLESRIDSYVLLITLLIAVVTSVLIGLAPALHSSRLGPAVALKEEAANVAGGLHKSRLASGLVVAQISLSFLLLVCAGLFLRSYQNTQRVDPGFDPRHVLLASFDLLPLRYTREQGIEFDRQLLAKLQAAPGVESVTLANSVPFGSGHHTQDIECEGYVPRPHESMEAWRANVGPDYFATMRIPLVSGRDISVRDSEKSQPVVVVNQALADRYWPGQEALGRKLRAYGSWFTVVGVAKNSKFLWLTEKPNPMIFLPLSQAYYHDPTIHLRVSGDPLAYETMLQRTVDELNRDVPLFNVNSLERVTETASSAQRITGGLVGILGLMALALASVGIYGVIAYTTSQRVCEIGIRLALGASSGSIQRLILGRGLRLAVAGLCLGLVASVVAAPSLKNLLFGVAAIDALTYTGVGLALLLVALIACYIPARRAVQISPALTLRHQ